jgi:hypothetical protein
MNQRSGGLPRSLLLFPVAVLALLLAAPTARSADEPQLVVHLRDESSVAYPVTSIMLVELEDGALSVRTTSGRHVYALATVARLDFRLNLTSIQDPRSTAALLAAVRLFQNRPNPFVAHTDIEFQLPSPGRVRLQIWSPDGRLVRTLLDGEMPPGTHTLRWDGLDDAGHRMPGGVYFYGLTGSGVDEARRMILLP